MSTRKLIWAVDVLESPAMQERAAALIRGFARKGPVEVQAVYMPILAHLRLPVVDFSGPWIEEYRQQAESTLMGLMERHGLGSFGRAVMIENNSPSTLDAVHALSRYATEIGVDAIVVSTHGRSGLGRLLLGSFAETLLQNSTVPVITVGPQMTELGQGMDSILFPSDFRARATRVYRQVVDFARSTGTKLKLFHSLQPDFEAILQAEPYLANGAWVPAGMPGVSGITGLAAGANEFGPEQRRTWVEKRACRWRDWANRRGVDCVYVIDEEGGSVGDAILRAANADNTGLIAIEAESGPVSAMLLGSITRHVVRHATCPVMVFRTVKAGGAHGLVPRAGAATRAA